MEQERERTREGGKMFVFLTSGVGSSENRDWCLTVACLSKAPGAAFGTPLDADVQRSLKTKFCFAGTSRGARINGGCRKVLVTFNSI